MTSTERAEQIKRLHLNILMQGAAIDASSDLTSIEDLDRIHPELGHLNTLVGVGMQLSQFEAKSLPLTGWAARDPRRYWKAVGTASHPFTGSRLLASHALALADATYEDGAERADRVGMARVGVLVHDRRLIENIKRAHAIEAEHRRAVQDLGRSLVAGVWGIPVERLHANLHHSTRPGLMLDGQKAPKGTRQFLNAACAAGWSRVVFDTPARVEAAALVFSLLRHELVKGVAELCCAHGLAELDDATYSAVLEVADKITLERPGMQVGPTLYRWWRDTLPDELTPAVGLTHLSLADPDIVESALIAVVEDPNAAREIMLHLCGDSILGQE